jgi:hypothetical protein
LLRTANNSNEINAQTATAATLAMRLSIMLTLSAATPGQGCSNPSEARSRRWPPRLVRRKSRRAHDATRLSERNTMNAPTVAPKAAATRAQNSKHTTALSVSCSPKTKTAITQARNAAALAPPKTHAIHFATRITGFMALFPPNDPSSATRRTGRNDCNRDAPAGFAAAHG